MSEIYALTEISDSPYKIETEINNELIDISKTIVLMSPWTELNTGVEYDSIDDRMM
jgi:hypothetical protein